jgi:hypothetical protein
MVNAGPSQGVLARRGIPARNGGMSQQPPMSQPPMMGGPRRMPQPMPPMPMMTNRDPIGPPNGGLNIGPSPDLSAKLGMIRSNPNEGITPQPGMGYLGGNPNFDESGRRPPIGMINSSPNEGLRMPIASSNPNEGIQPMKFGGMPMNIGGPDVQQTQPLWQRYAMMNRGM